MKRALLAVLALSLAACVGVMTRDGETISPAECSARGGTRTGIQGQACALPAADAGQSCAKSTDCAGACMADTRTCSAFDVVVGCFEFLDEIGQRVGICVD